MNGIHRGLLALAVVILGTAADAAVIRVPQDALTPMAAFAAALDGDVIEIAAGTYPITQTLNTAGRRLVVRGAADAKGQLLTVLDGQGTVAIARCVTAETAETVFERLAFIRGRAASASTLQAGFGGGGAIFIDGASPTVRDCEFRENSAVGYGGAVWTHGSRSRFERCAFSANSAQVGGGLGVFRGDSLVTQCRFEGNTTAGAIVNSTGGGGALAYESDVTFEGCEFRSNYGFGFGGGLAALCLPDQAQTIRDCVFESNECGALGGGATYIGGRTVIERCTFDANTTNLRGGAIVVESAGGPNGYLMIMDCSFNGNAADTAGAIAAWGGEASDIRLLRTKITGNTARAGPGGAIHCGVTAQGGTFTLSDCTISGNSATSSGAIHSVGTLTATRCIITSNVASAATGATGGIACVAGQATVSDTRICGNSGMQTSGPVATTGSTCVATACSGCSDSDGDGIPNAYDNCPGLPNPTQADCDADGLGDACEIAGGASDANGNGIPDGCEPCPGDSDGNGLVDGLDLGRMLGAWGVVDGQGACTACDLNADGVVNGVDLGALLGHWGPCF
jgi:hypothetical protein